MVEENRLLKLKYLNAIIKEAFRLHPVLPILVPWTPHASCVVGGYTIPKGSNIFLNMGYIQRDPKIWDKPSEFRFERCLKDPSKYDLSGNNFTYMPFGSGRRWDLPQGVELDLLGKFGLVVKKMKPPVAIPKPRLSSPELYMSSWGPEDEVMLIKSKMFLVLHKCIRPGSSQGGGLVCSGCCIFSIDFIIEYSGALFK
ncbi:cytochrome P450 71AU50-like [Eucalyptus grandis]|uniref:cytochrome P450 71AU50-like n=1 Tax=Eucalyptus grandis TaxID=71139 RepID=UPI00192E904D|nr:cytochrome P450 71AU50-like [Eucalyptus grandis]